MSQLHRVQIMVKVSQLGQLDELEELQRCHTIDMYCATDKGKIVRRGCQGVANCLVHPLSSTYSLRTLPLILTIPRMYFYSLLFVMKKVSATIMAL